VRSAWWRGSDPHREPRPAWRDPHREPRPAWRLRAQFTRLPVAARAAPPQAPSELAKRLMELLYCEACGELFVGGMRSTNVADRPIDLLSASANLEALPFASAGTEFEDLAYGADRSSNCLGPLVRVESVAPPQTGMLRVFLRLSHAGLHPTDTHDTITRLLERRARVARR